MVSGSETAVVVAVAVLTSYSLIEVARGWRILRRGQPSLNVALSIRVVITKLIWGKEVAGQYETLVKSDRSMMKIRGWYSLVGGLLGLVGAALIFWAQFVRRVP